MAMGIPVLAAHAGVLPTIVQHGETGFVYRDGSEFARYAHQLADDPEFRQRMGLAGRKRVAACYSTDSWVDNIAAVLAGAASQRV
jgi:glycosyltransferase involved in cell wall biosynthesis